MERYVSIYEEEVLEEAFVPGSKKPDTEGGKYIITKGMGPDPKNKRRYIPGFWKKKKAGKLTKAMKQMGSKTKRKQAGRKAAISRKHNPRAVKKGQKQAARTRAKNK